MAKLETIWVLCHETDEGFIGQPREAYTSEALAEAARDEECFPNDYVVVEVEVVE